MTTPANTTTRRRRKRAVTATAGQHDTAQAKAQAEREQRADSARTVQAKEAMLLALRQHLGIITFACEDTGIPRRTYYNWIANDPAFAAEANEVQKVELDFVKRKLMEQIEAGDTRAIKYYLDHKGQAEGFGRPQRLVLTGDERGGPVQLEANLHVNNLREELPDASLKAALGDLLRANPDLLTA
jgi:hypothetical protein